MSSQPARAATATEAADTQRARIVDAAIEAYREGDFGTVDAYDVAVRAGIGVEGVEQTFPCWDDLVIAVADRWNGGSRRALMSIGENEGAVAYLRALVHKADRDRPIVRMRMAVLSAASDPNHGAAVWFRQQYVQFTRDIALLLTRDIVVGREPRTMNPRHAAEQLIALYEGLQAQSILLDGVDLLASWDRAVVRMRTGWSTPYVPQS